MPEARLKYIVEAEDDTAPAAEEMSGRWGGLFDGLAARALAIGAALVTGIEDAFDTTEDLYRRIRLTTGTDSEGRELVADLLRDGVPEEDAITAVAALQGQSRNLEVVPDNPVVARALADIATLGGSPRSAAGALTGFGVAGEADVFAGLNIATLQGLSAGVDASTLYTALEDYGPVLAAFGLNFLESAALIVDLEQQGIPVSRVGPALNAFIRNASAAGQSPRSEGLTAVEQLRTASEIDAYALGQELFGAEGGLRLTRAIRSGAVGFGDELALDPNLGSLPSLAALTEPTNRDTAEGAFAALLADPDSELHERLLGAIGSRASDLPLIGGAVSGILGLAIGDTPTASQRLGDLNPILRALSQTESATADALATAEADERARHAEELARLDSIAAETRAEAAARPESIIQREITDRLGTQEALRGIAAEIAAAPDTAAQARVVAFWQDLAEYLESLAAQRPQLPDLSGRDIGIAETLRRRQFIGGFPLPPDDLRAYIESDSIVR